MKQDKKNVNCGILIYLSNLKGKINDIQNVN